MFVIDRRAALIGAISLLAVSCAPEGECGSPETGPCSAAPDLSPLFEALEKSAGGRLGAFVLDTETRLGSGWRENERFAHCSSFKMSLAAMFLDMGDRGEVDLAERLTWTEADLLPNSDFTREHMAGGLTLEELAHTTLVTSDNAAANLLLKKAGGPFKLTEFWRSLGDTVSRVDRYEPEMNEVPPGTELDTTTPAAMASTVAKLVHGDALQPRSREKLRAWMAEVETGKRRLRAGLPAGWISGDKTGTGFADSRTYVDLAYAGPAGRKPLIIAAYYEPATESEEIDPAAEAVLADVGKIAAESIAPSEVALFGLTEQA